MALRLQFPKKRLHIEHKCDVHYLTQQLQSAAFYMYILHITKKEITHIPAKIPILTPIRHCIDKEESNKSLNEANVPINPRKAKIPVVQRVASFAIYFLFNIIRRMFSYFLLHC